MESDSDTESESNSLSPLPTSPTCDDLLATASSVPIVDLDEVKQEIQKLSDPNFHCDPSINNESRLDELQQSANTAIAFVTQLPELLLEDNALEVLLTFANLGMFCHTVTTTCSAKIKPALFLAYS